MIDRFEVENYKSLRKVTVDLGRLTVFVGPNGSGKSSTLLAQSATPGPGDGHPPHHRFSHLFGGRGVLTRVAASPDLPVRLGARSSTGDTLRVSGVPTPSLRSADLGPADLPMVCQVAIGGPAGSSHVIFPPHDLAQLTGFAEGRLGPFAGSGAAAPRTRAAHGAVGGRRRGPVDASGRVRPGIPPRLDERGRRR